MELMTLVDPLMASPLLYPLLVGLCSLDGVLPMIPSEAVVLAAGVFAHGGGPSLLLIVLVTALGVFIGDHLAYGLSRSVLGPRLINRSKHVSRAVAAAGRQLDRRPGLLIVTSRFLPGGRVTMNLACGTARLPLSRFTPASAIAALAWAAYTAGLGYLGGAAFVENPLLGLALGLGLSFVLGGIVELIRRRAANRKVRPAGSAGRLAAHPKVRPADSAGRLAAHRKVRPADSAGLQHATAVSGPSCAGPLRDRGNPVAARPEPALRSTHVRAAFPAPEVVPAPAVVRLGSPSVPAGPPRGRRWRRDDDVTPATRRVRAPRPATAAGRRAATGGRGDARPVLGVPVRPARDAAGPAGDVDGRAAAPPAGAAPVGRLRADGLGSGGRCAR
jgi:membrane protein DedA with SNARE-associated domain